PPAAPAEPPEEEEDEEEDAFAAVQVPPAAFLGAAAAGSRGRLNSFTAGVLPAPFGRTSPQGSVGGSGELGQPGPAAAFELQRSRVAGTIIFHLTSDTPHRSDEMDIIEKIEKVALAW
ncbi:hypothetical protein IHE44_0000929, partial [Lamprotornis superbus]